jgi:two-component system, chemotaxis family, response regulator Rcp1
MSALPAGKPIDILLVEDGPGDIRLTQEALKEGRVTNRLHVATDGEAAMSFLLRRPPYTDAPRPDLVLLDLNLPKKDGREVLAEIKGHASLQRIPVVVLTTSRAEQDVHQAYQLRCNCYITKPVDLEQFLRVIESIQDFWLTVVTLPPEVENT